MTNPRLRSERGRAFVSWVLILGFLLQPVLVYLVTPFVAQDTEGHTVVMCTLKGQQWAEIDLPFNLDQPSDQLDAEHCSALKLFQMASTTQVSAPVVASQVLMFSIAAADQTADQPHRRLHFSAYSTRAPPHSA